MSNLLILESPNKIAKVKAALGGSFTVKASLGHIKDLPKNGDIGVDIDNKTYTPKFQVSDAKHSQILKDLKNAAKGSTVYIATDPDREGYAIGQHIYDELKNVADKVMKVEFFEITEKHVKQKIKEAIPYEKTNFGTYESFLGRRVTDRLVGWIMSAKVRKGLGLGKASAGRVQSVAVRLVKDREDEIRNFKPEKYYVISIDCEKDGKKFRAFYEVKDKLKDKNLAQAIAQKIRQANKASVSKVEQKETSQSPWAPFTTSSFQMTASAKLRISPEQAMSLAQGLFEKGYISYHRTDSTKLSEEFISEARNFIQQNFGKQYIPETPKRYKSKNSQNETHEAIRPTHVDPLNKTAQDILKDGLNERHIAIYKLIFERAVGCQMSDAKYDQTTVVLNCENEHFKAVGRVMKFDGHLRLTQDNDGGDEDAVAKKKEQEEDSGGDQQLPKIAQGEQLAKVGDNMEEKQTKPPARYTEGSLIKELEKRGIGRPSTYASITGKIKGGNKGIAYVTLQKGKLYITKEGDSLIEFLKSNDPWCIDYEMTKNMEDFLDDVEERKKSWKELAKYIHEKLAFATTNDIRGAKFVTIKMKEFAQKIAQQKGLDISSIMDDPEKLSDFISNNRDRKPSEKAIEFARGIAQKTGAELSPEVQNDFELLSKWIDKNKKNLPVTFSEKQIEIFRKNNQEDLLKDPIKARKWLDDYFKSFKKGGSKGGAKKNTKSWGNKNFTKTAHKPNL